MSHIVLKTIYVINNIIENFEIFSRKKLKYFTKIKLPIEN
jgi:hypothetical protein